MSIKAFVRIACLALPLAIGGCGLFGIGGTPPQTNLSNRTSGSPYAGLAGNSVAIVVYAPQATLNEYTATREEICAFVVNQMRQHMPTTRILDPDDLITWQNSTLNWANLSARDIGRHFNVDRVIAIQVLDYSTKRPLGVSNFQGRLRVQCHIYNTAEDAAGLDANGHLAPAWTGLVDAAWPSGKPLDPTQTNESAVRLRTLDAFADLLVQFFYERREPDSSMRG